MKNGYITVYLSLVTGVLLSLVLMIIEGVRMHTIRTQTECVMDMALDSALAEYHRELLEQYDLFFVDTSYGMGSPTTLNTAEHIRDYMNLNFRPYELLEIPVGKELTGLQADRVQITEASAAADEDKAVMKRQIIDYMLNRYGIGYLNQAGANADAIRQSGFLENDVSARRESTRQHVKNSILQKEQEEEEDWEGRNVELPSDVVDQVRGEGILSMAAGNTAKLSRTYISKGQLFSGRGNPLQGTGLPEGVEAADSLAETGLLYRYIQEKCGSYGKEKGQSAFSYQIEYILEGKDNDLENLRRIANQILMIREAANVAYLFGDGAKRAEAEGTALLLTSLLGLPELTEPIADLILFAWGYAESVQDLRILLDGECVPLIKTADSWNTPYSQLLTFRNHLSEYKKGQSGMNYQNYLEAFLYLRPEQQNLERLMDVMEADIRLTPGNQGFRIDGCINALTAEASVSSGFGYAYTIQRKYRYE